MNSRIRGIALGLVTSATLLLASACDDEDDEDKNHKCATELYYSTLNSLSQHTVSIDGNFPSNESVLIKFKDSEGATVQRGGTLTGTTMSFQGLPSGALTIEFIVSCTAADGQEHYSTHVINVK